MAKHLAFFEQDALARYVDQQLPVCLQVKGGFSKVKRAESWLHHNLGPALYANMGNPCSERPYYVYDEGQWASFGSSRMLFTRDAAVIARLSCDLFESSDAE